MSKSSGFQCKQFFVVHDRCAMKVSTDALLLGSWVEALHAKRVLDIGTGSGLLALMMAQKTQDGTRIDAIEYDAEACAQARQNIASSPWPHKVSVSLCDFHSFNAEHGYDLIVCNPPYFVGLGCDNTSSARKLARLDAQLSPDALFMKVSRLLLPEARFYCMYPADRYEVIEEALAATHLHTQQRLWVSSVEGRKPYLVLLCLSLRSAPLMEASLHVKTTNGHYSDLFKQLCQPFYLNF